jgi:hypothetical protein
MFSIFFFRFLNTTKSPSGGSSDLGAESERRSEERKPTVSTNDSMPPGLLVVVYPSKSSSNVEIRFVKPQNPTK